MNKQLLQFPLKEEPVVASAIFSGALAFCFWGVSIAGIFGMMMMPAIMILSMMFCQYGFDVGHDAAMGREIIPVYRFQGMQVQALLFVILTWGCLFLLIQNLGIVWGIICACLILPAMISSLVVERSLLRAVNPINWWSYIWQMKLAYFLPMLTLMGMMSLFYLIPDGIWLWPKLFIILSICLWHFHILGYILYQYRNDLKLVTPENKAERQERYSQEQDSRQFEERTDRWHRMAEVREFSRALADIQDYLDSQPNTFDAGRQIMAEIIQWRNQRLAAKFLPTYLAIVLPTGKVAMGYRAYKDLIESQGVIDLESDNLVHILIDYARDIGDHDFADRLASSLN